MITLAFHAFMNRDSSQSSFRYLHSSPKLPQSINESIAQIKSFALQEFDREVIEKQLYYHNREHLENVRRRSTLILQAIAPAWETRLQQEEPSIDVTRIELLLDLSIAAHDMIQVFISQSDRHTTRRRAPGVSERASFERLVDYINALNQQLQKHDPDSPAQLTDRDIAIIQGAIGATICTYAPTEQAIYQADLYDVQHPPSIVARILALADIGVLGIDGIEVYSHEGSLLFLEENLDVIPLLLDGTIDRLESDNPTLYQNIRQRLLRRCRFQVNFAKSRAARLKSELVGFPESTIETLTHDVFRYLNPATIQAIEATTPTAETASLESLLEFFELERYLDR
ncbi:MAG: hypothetical protein LH702_20745 [Phormidesmis sp. CAN_BIN44]|nr:hypothetical protein [Phormidesmis sp. CAN_BIN44]